MTDFLGKNGAPGEVRTPDHLVRSQVLERSYRVVFVQKVAALAGNIFRSFCALSTCFSATRPVLFPSLSLEKRPNFFRRFSARTAPSVPRWRAPSFRISFFWHRRVLTILTVLVFTSGCAHTDEWTRRDTVLQVGVTAALLADAITTSRIHDNPNVYESGAVAHRVLGRQPSTRDTYLYFGTLVISNYLITRALPEKWRKYWQSSQILVHGYAVSNNCDLDLC